ncbi:bifunctional 2-C-methyl-D-erythritol 4-phosphate cytidylyltransferase/2-C-methyl-D-erythritol 2,4-cyclodiphosphate synthase [Pseudotabrizicola algicola]|uniref:Bifunctional enzyme IspD/IspF n=1 Tax=Pseudotabrizicola algicola TaxID=2709381 RepID=A0A6B3RPI4_9RHOB|nr:bifunctional 2-C-methyl-D-erythritol 4-phosphate cytidylyltransferase/2-C-methyl-D-erythritol 2,4-cyclodiphosphate synthase [Pseudotabrizicola algicola]NEX44962.1 bifunctional 2-C-methyl-D-erythritol 4-phosphate cytidylyltransferase/2-C-methyl-D-erythritol 2,4-cyclodiphosphate synthase [Pseudotabrizicola algicola]
MTTAAIIVAAGRGTRAGGDLPKQWQDLAGQPVLVHSVRAFRGLVDQIVLVIHPEDIARAEGFGLPIVTGADTRAGSVRNALEWLDGRGVTKVLIHDGARPLVPEAVVTAVLGALDSAPGAAPALPVSDALWRGTAQVEGTAARDGLWRAQTPQGFHFESILAAHRAHPGGAADDVEVARWAGHAVTIVPGDEDNLKLTYPGDFTRAASILKGRKMEIRLGNGFDVHAFTEGNGVWLCGVHVPHGRALLGHSDADVGMHALTDAIYGALAEGDIGVHFPPSDPQWKGAASHIFLRHAMERVAARGYRVANCDVTLVCERPKIGPHQAAMRAALADIMGIEAERISVKATTSERLGFTGREEGIAALASCTLVPA